jgi:hypothetical protein
MAKVININKLGWRTVSQRERPGTGVDQPTHSRDRSALADLWTTIDLAGFLLRLLSRFAFDPVHVQ